MCNKDNLKEVPHQFENIDESWKDIVSSGTRFNDRRTGPSIWDIGVISLADITVPLDNEIRNIAAAMELSVDEIPLPIHSLDMDERISEIPLADFTPCVLGADIIIFQRYKEIISKPECDRTAEEKNFLSKFIEIDSMDETLKQPATHSKQRPETPAYLRASNTGKSDMAALTDGVDTLRVKIKDDSRIGILSTLMQVGEINIKGGGNPKPSKRDYELTPYDVKFMTPDDPIIAAMFPVKKPKQPKNKPWYQQGKSSRRF